MVQEPLACEDLAVNVFTYLEITSQYSCGYCIYTIVVDTAIKTVLTVIVRRPVEVDPPHASRQQQLLFEI